MLSPWAALPATLGCPSNNSKPFFDCLHSYCARVFRNTPTTYASEAATPPTTRVEIPDRHHDAVDHMLFTEPMMKKTTPVRAIETMKAFANPKRNGSNGTTPQIANALKVAAAARQGERGSSGNPYSSVNIVRTQRSGSDVIKPTPRSRSAPSKPFAAKI